MLDAFDVMLYALLLTSIIADLGISRQTAGAIGSVTLLAAAAGGLLFGVIADRYGRTRALMASVAIYSVFTAACGLATNASAARRVSHPARHRHGRRVGERRSPGLRDMARRASRQSPRPDAERLGNRLRTGCRRDDGGAAAVGVARGLLRRRAAGVSHVLGAAPRTGARAVAEQPRFHPRPRPSRRRFPRRPRRRHGCGNVDERVHAVCVVGLQPVAAGLSFVST